MAEAEQDVSIHVIDVYNTARSLHVTVRADATLADLMHEIARRHVDGPAPDKQRIVASGRVVTDLDAAVIEQCTVSQASRGALGLANVPGSVVIAPPVATLPLAAAVAPGGKPLVYVST